jgi:hypothetical protein
MAIFKPERTIPTPTKDTLSWIFDDPHYDQDEPVCLKASHFQALEQYQLTAFRSILMLKLLQDQFLQIKLV